MSQNRMKVGQFWKTRNYGTVYINRVEALSVCARVWFIENDGTQDSFTGNAAQIGEFFETPAIPPYFPPTIIFKQGSYYLRYSDGVDVIIPRFRFGEQKEDALSTKPKYYNDAVCDDSCDCDDEDDDDDDEFGCGIEDLDCCECGVEGACQNLNIAAQNVTINVSNYYDGSVAKSE